MSEERPIITFTVTQRNIVAIFIVLMTGVQGGNLYFNWSTNIAMAKIEAVLPIKEKQFDELKVSIDKNNTKDEDEHNDLFRRVYDLEMSTGIKRKQTTVE